MEAGYGMTEIVMAGAVFAHFDKAMRGTFKNRKTHVTIDTRRTAILTRREWDKHSECRGIEPKLRDAECGMLNPQHYRRTV